MSTVRKLGGAHEARQLRRTDEARVVVRAFGQHPRDVFGADHREKVRLHVAVQRGKEYPAARLHERLHASTMPAGLRHVLEHFHAGDDVVRARLAGGERLGGDLFVIDGHTTFKAVKIGHAERAGSTGRCP